MKTNKLYQKLPGTRKRFLGRNTLWEASDHLLYIESTMISESYKRFYYKDIQSLVIAKTMKGKISNSILGLVIFLNLALVVYFKNQIMGIAVFFLIIAVFFVISLAVNTIMGPTCICMIQTAVQKEKLLSLDRLKRADKVANQILPKIEIAQGRLSPEALSFQKPHGGSEPASRATRSEVKHKKPEPSPWHMGLFILMIFAGLCHIFDLLYSHFLLTFAGSILLMAISVCSIIAIVKQHNSALQKLTKAISWCGLGYVVVSFVMGYAIYMFLVIQNLHKPEIVYNNWEMIKLVTSLSPHEYPLLMAGDVFLICGSLLIGFAGLLSVRIRGK